MSEFFKKRTAGNWVHLAAAVFALVMLIVYASFTSPYGLMDTGAIICFVFNVLLNIGLFIFETPINEYIKIILCALAAADMAYFIVACIGDISDHINGVGAIGSGAPFAPIIAIAVFLFVLVVVQIVACALGKRKQN